MKRQYRQPSEATKAKISASMKQYWRTVPSRPESLSMAEYLGKTKADNNNNGATSTGNPKYI